MTTATPSPDGRRRRAVLALGDAYCKRYWIGRYGPRGSHFFACAIKDAVVRWLEPRPVAYRGNGHDAMAAVARMTGGATVGGG